MLYTDFYSELGKLLYAVADIDGKISEGEKKALKELVKTELLNRGDRDEFGTDAGFYTEFEFEIMDEQNITPETALDSFLQFLQEHRTAIYPELKSVCMKVAEKLANAYYGTNKNEEKLLKKIRQELQLI